MIYVSDLHETTPRHAAQKGAVPRAEKRPLVERYDDRHLRN